MPETKEEWLARNKDRTALPATYASDPNSRGKTSFESMVEAALIGFCSNTSFLDAGTRASAAIAAAQAVFDELEKLRDPLAEPPVDIIPL